MLKINIDNLPKLLAALSEVGKLHVPCENKAGKVDFTKWNLEKRPRFDITLTSKSAKDLFFPQVEDLLTFKTEGKNLSIEQIMPSDKQVILMGVRACDIRSFELLDKVFLKDPVDSYYKARRENTLIIGMACSEPEETCFCTTFGINPTVPGGDASVYFDGESYFFVPFTDKGKAFMASIADMLEEGDVTKLSEVQAKAREIMTRLPLANLTTDSFGGERLMEHFNSEKWAELSEACIGCGTCTFVCPTCQCYDIRDYDTGNGIKRFRCWDSCMYSDFTQMAHGNPRTSQLERFRQRFMHKLVYHPSNHDGEFGCVGCGRCLSKCPVSLNIVKVMKALEDK